MESFIFCGIIIFKSDLNFFLIFCCKIGDLEKFLIKNKYCRFEGKDEV